MTVKSVLTSAKTVFEDGEWWYIPSEGKRERLDQYQTKNSRRMWVNGKYIPRSHPLWKAGRFKSLDDAWSHQQIEQTKEGEVYAIVNSAWPEWVKIGKAVSADDRLNGYQTSSPFRDYEIVAKIAVDNRHTKEKEMHKAFEYFADDRKGEWFKIDKVSAIKIFNMHNVHEIVRVERELESAA